MAPPVVNAAHTLRCGGLLPAADVLWSKTGGVAGCVALCSLPGSFGIRELDKRVDRPALRRLSAGVVLPLPKISTKRREKVSLDVARCIRGGGVFERDRAE